MHGDLPFHPILTEKENISGTLPCPGEATKASPLPLATGESPWPGCAFIAAWDWEPGAAPYCGAPVQPGSSYCAAHHRLCYLDPEAIAALEEAQAQPHETIAPSRRVRCLALAATSPEEEEEGPATATLDEFRCETSSAEEERAEHE